MVMNYRQIEQSSAGDVRNKWLHVPPVEVIAAVAYEQVKVWKYLCGVLHSVGELSSV